MILHDVAESWAGRLCAMANRTDTYEKALMAYAIEGYLAVCYGLVLLVLAGWAIGAFWESLIVAATAAFFKSFTGGAHLSTPTRCALVGTVILAGLGLLAKYVSFTMIPAPVLWSILAFDNLCVWLYAPVAVPEKPLVERQRAVLGVLARMAIALLTLACLFWVKLPWLTAIFAGGSFQCLSLGKTARWLVAALDKALPGTRVQSQGP